MEAFVREGEHAETRAAFREMVAANREFDSFKRELGWDAEPHQWEAKASETVTKYIDVVKENRGRFTEDALLDDELEFYKLDPVFSVILRATLGADSITKPVFDKLRDSWCHSDLPDDVDAILRIQDDQEFVRRFEALELSTYGNIKLLALQKQGIRTLVKESSEIKDK